jgi:hypothetical protein
MLGAANQLWAYRVASRIVAPKGMVLSVRLPESLAPPVDDGKARTSAATFPMCVDIVITDADAGIVTRVSPRTIASR